MIRNRSLFVLLAGLLVAGMARAQAGSDVGIFSLPPPPYTMQHAGEWQAVNLNAFVDEYVNLETRRVSRENMPQPSNDTDTSGLTGELTPQPSSKGVTFFVRLPVENG